MSPDSDSDSHQSKRKKSKKSSKSRRHTSSDDSSPDDRRRARSRSPVRSSKHRSTQRESSRSKTSSSQRKSSKHSKQKSGDRHRGAGRRSKDRRGRSSSEDSVDEDDRRRIAAAAKKMSTAALKAEIAATKERMRKSLEDAGKTKDENIPVDPTLAKLVQSFQPEEVIKIDAPGFEPQSFQSSRTDRASKPNSSSSAANNNSTSASSVGDAHAAAIFGTANILDARALTKNVRLEEEEDCAPMVVDLAEEGATSATVANRASAKEDDGIFSAQLFDSEEVRWTRWADLLCGMRKTLAEGKKL